MSKKEQTEQRQPRAQPEEPKPRKTTPRGQWFRAVAQVRFPAQMEVIDYIMQEPYFQALKVLHSRDVYTADDFAEGKKNVQTGPDGRKFIEISMPDGSKVKKYQGDKKEDHVHILVRIPKRQTQAGFNKEFCGLLHFELVESPEANYRYMQHIDFESKKLKKAVYSPHEIEGDIKLKDELSAVCCNTNSVLDYAIRWRELVQACGGDVKAALSLALDNGEKELVGAIASHGYFFKSFFENS